MNKEVWKDIKELDNYYEISNFGRIRSKSREIKGPYGTRFTNVRIIASFITTKGYQGVRISLFGNKYNFFVHRLVALYFIPNTENKPQVNHKDGNKQNNNDWNLEWSTNKENCVHASIIKLSPMGERSYCAILDQNKVLAIRRLHKINPKFKKVKIAQKLGISLSALYQVIVRTNWKHI